MSRRRGSSVARNSPAQQPGLNRQLRRWLAAELRNLRPVICQSAIKCNANRYRKHFTCFAHFCLLLFHGLSRGESLRQSYAAFASCRGLAILSGLVSERDRDGDQVGVSYSQFAASNTTRPADFLSGIIPTLITRVRQMGQLAQASFPPTLHTFDSTFLRLSLVLSSWLPNSGPNVIPGVRLHIQYSPALDLPEHVLVTDTRTADGPGFDATVLDDPERLARLRGHTLVIDLGYYSHRRFARLRATRVHFVSRLREQASVQIEAELPVQQVLPGMYSQRISIHKDQRITLGSAANSAGAVLPGLRLVTAEVAPLPKAAQRGSKPIVYKVLTDRWDLTAADVIQIYIWRWQIELFLRWLKSHIHLPRLIGYSHNAVAMSVSLAIIVHLLTVLAAHALGWSRRTPTLLSKLRWALPQLTEADAIVPPSDVTQLHFADWELPLAAPT